MRIDNSTEVVSGEDHYQVGISTEPNDDVNAKQKPRLDAGSMTKAIRVEPAALAHPSGGYLKWRQLASFLIFA